MQGNDVQAMQQTKRLFGVVLAVIGFTLFSACGGGGAVDSTPAAVQKPQVPPSSAAAADDDAAQVREMADSANNPVPGSLLEQQMIADGHTTATCLDYALTLLEMLKRDQRFTGQARQVNVALNLGWNADGTVRGGFDVHALVELLQDDSRWTLIDPTFGLVPTDTQGGALSAVELSHLTRAHDWAGIQFRYLTAAGDAYAQGYYLDYPLLFVNVATATGMQKLVDPMLSADDLGYFYSLVGTVVSQHGLYVAHCAAGADSDSTFGVQLPCSVQGFSTAQFADAGQNEAGIYTPRRFVFSNPQP